MKQLLDFKLLVSGKLSNSMNIMLFEWYKPHSLHDFPEPMLADPRKVKGANPNIHREGV